jgi:hypothetical protein
MDLKPPRRHANIGASRLPASKELRVPSRCRCVLQRGFSRSPPASGMALPASGMMVRVIRLADRGRTARTKDQDCLRLAPARGDTMRSISSHENQRRAAGCFLEIDRK